MARIAGVDLQDNWRIDYALTRIRGIGWPLSRKILTELKVPSEKRFSEITADELTRISSKLEDYVIEGDLARKVKADIARLITIGSYRGGRHSRNLPSRGQRTRTNARTKRGKRKTVGAFKKEILNKMEINKEEAKK
jgi:small subunit ribosomal protein S13